ncbi:MAG: hypothetical protein HQ542_05460 [Bacteroidia bacterium]|nr:hypothetical protein [Bacteroidia bacterium]
MPDHLSFFRIFAKNNLLTLSGITIDGNLSDPSWCDIPWSAQFVDIEGEHLPAPPLETRMKMAWDDSCIYIAARRCVWGAM